MATDYNKKVAPGRPEP